MLVAPSGDASFLGELKRQGPTARGFTQMVPHSRAWAGLDEEEADGRSTQVHIIAGYHPLKPHKSLAGPLSQFRRLQLGPRSLFFDLLLFLNE